jgi:Leucine-rich repeat (LRR) protein
MELMSNHLTNISVLTGMTNIIFLTLANNVNLMLNEVDFSNFSNIKTMELCKVSLDRGAKYQKLLPPSLTRVDLSGNNLASLDLDQLSHLKLFNLDDNGLKVLDFERIPTIFPKLVQIDLSENGFSEELKRIMFEFFARKRIGTGI